MPNRDRTGPQGKGPRTGQQRGNCEGTRFQRRQGMGIRLANMSLDEREDFLKSQLELVYKEREKNSM